MKNIISVLISVILATVLAFAAPAQAVNRAAADPIADNWSAYWCPHHRLGVCVKRRHDLQGIGRGRWLAHMEGWESSFADCFVGNCGSATNARWYYQRCMQITRRGRGIHGHWGVCDGREYKVAKSALTLVPPNDKFRWTHRKRKVARAMARKIGKKQCYSKQVILDSGPWLKCRHWYADRTLGYGAGVCHFWGHGAWAVCYPFARIKNMWYGRPDKPAHLTNFLWDAWDTFGKGGVVFGKTSGGTVYQVYDDVEWKHTEIAPSA